MANEKKEVLWPNAPEWGKYMPKVKVKIPKNPVGEDQSALPVSVNGWKFWIPRGQWVEIPECHAEVVEHMEHEMEVADDYIRAKMN